MPSCQNIQKILDQLKWMQILIITYLVGIKIWDTLK